jgi:hypothetical protein
MLMKQWDMEQWKFPMTVSPLFAPIDFDTDALCVMIRSCIAQRPHIRHALRARLRSVQSRLADFTTRMGNIINEHDRSVTTNEL